MSLREAVARELDRLAAEGGTISYGALARLLDIPGPGRIARLAASLEDLMAEDAAATHPLRAALCEGRLAGGMPAPGFFAAAARLGRYDGPSVGPDAMAFVAAERAALWAAARTRRPPPDAG